MNRTMEYLYYIKMVYLNAGRALMKENYSYYANLVNKQRINLICENIYKKDCDFYLSFRDTAGCAAQQIMRSVAGYYKDKSNIFIITDCYGCDDSIKGIFVADMDIYLFCDNEYKFINTENISLHRCYYRQDMSRHSAKKLYSMADSYFEKSKYIAKNSCL